MTTPNSNNWRRMITSIDRWTLTAFNAPSRAPQPLTPTL